jgi:hypothetical protein
MIGFTATPRHSSGWISETSVLALVTVRVQCVGSNGRVYRTEWAGHTFI